MDPNGDNSNDSVEIDLLAGIPSLAVGLPTHITVSDPTAVLNGALPLENHDIPHPRVVIVEQPQQRGFRFRYECEGPSHGGLQGISSERSRKTYPAIRIENYQGPARIEVSLVTDEKPPRIHAHKLVGKNCTDGICRVEIGSTASEISFPNLCVLHVTRKKAAEVLMNRILEDVKLQKTLASGSKAPQTTTAEENLNAKKQAQDQAQNMSLNVVRLQFRVLLLNAEKQIISMLTPVVSQPIYDSKSPGASALKICRMDKYGGCCTGNEEVFLLCEKVQKEDIAVRFVEHNPDGSVKWEAYGNFSPLDVHRQYAIVFKTPAYYNANIDKAVNVMIMLQRKSDADVSEAKAFTYYPQNRDKDLIARKKRKKLPLDNSFNYYGGDGGPPGGGPPGSGGGMGGGFGGPPAAGGPGGGGLNGDGGGGGQGNYSVIMPNGNIMDHMSMLPTTVEQVVKEEFTRCQSVSSASMSAEDSSPLSSPFDPMLWTGSPNDDLEMDAAPSPRHPSQTLVSTAESPSTKCLHINPNTSAGKLSSSCAKLERDCASEKDVGLKFSKNNKAHEDVSFDKLMKTDSKGSTMMDSNDKSIPSPVSFDKLMKTDSKGSAMMDSNDKSIPSLESTERLLTTDKQTDEVIIDSEVANTVWKVDKPENLTVPREEESRRDEQSDTVQSPTKLSVVTMPLERMRSDEGFSEVSEEGSVKEEVQSRKTDFDKIGATDSYKPRTTSTPTKRKNPSEGTQEAYKMQVKMTTTVVKRVMERITVKTVRALQDFSETGDIRYLLIVQRHLTAFKNENGDLPIHLAVINNQTAPLCHLLDVMVSLPNARRSVNAYNYMRQTALHMAAIMQQPIHIELLLHADANPSLADRNGNTPAHLAVLNNSLPALQSLIKYLRPGVSAINPFPELNYLNYDGYSPVHLAAQSGNVEMLRLLVHGKANVNLPDGKSGRTALHHAVEMDDLPVAGFLLMEASADVNARSFDGNTPLHIACCQGLMGMVALLMTAGALVNIENEEIPPEEGLEQEEEIGEEEMHKCRRGLLPSDYATGKDRQQSVYFQIMNMLMGDGYLSDGEERHHSMDDDDDLEEDTGAMIAYKSACDSGLATSLPLHSDHSPSSLPVKDQLSFEVREELSKLLDPVHTGKDVYTLANRLGYDHLITALEVLGCSGSSPTHYLLSYHETYGTMSKLKDCLRDMQCKDAVQLIQGGLTGMQQKKQLCDLSEVSLSRDSGVISFIS